MFIEAVKIRIIGKSGKEYGRYVNFLVEGEIAELNMVYGENTLGKSTLIQSIIYGLNGEAIYGKKSREIINYKIILERFLNDELIQAQIFLQLSNMGKRVVVLRDAMNNTEPVIIFKDIDLIKEDDGTTLDEKANEKEYFKIKKDINIIGNKTYQEFLFAFFNIEPIRKMDEDDQEEGMIFYIENMMPLFVIQQEAWTDIQAINPRYGIKDIKKTAFEFILNFSSANEAKYDHLLEYYNALLKQKENSIKDIQGILHLLNHADAAEVEAELIKRNDLIKEYKNKLNEMEKGKHAADNVLNELRNKHKHLNQIFRRHQESINLLDSEIEQYEYYINKIELDIEKNDKLKTAKKLIGKLPIESCPRCLNDISINYHIELESGHCDLCGSELKVVERVEETNDYLKDERKDFQRLIKDKSEARNQIESKLFSVQLDLNEIKKTMNSYEEQLKPENLESYHYYSREIGSLENSLKELERDKEVLNKYESIKVERDNISGQIKNLRKKKSDAKKKQDSDGKKLRFFQKEFKEILFELEFLKNGFDKEKVKNLDDSIKGKTEQELTVIDKIYKQITIDLEDYYPKIEGVNLYNITSSSGLIRIILAYYLALLKTGLKYKEQTNHPLLLILDEPRQQNLDMDTFNQFLEQFRLLQEKYPGQFQIILASSEKGNAKQNEIRLDLDKNTFLIKEISNK